MLRSISTLLLISFFYISVIGSPLEFKNTSKFTTVCSIIEVYAEVTACEGEVFDVLVNFEYIDVSDSFRIQGNGVNYGNFAYSNLPIHLLTLEADCETPYEFVAIDIKNNDCSGYTELGIVCCNNDCNIYDLYAEVTPCEEEAFDVLINFEYENISDSFRIQGNGTNYGYFSYNDLPITLLTLNADCETNYEFIAIDSENNNCSDATGIGIVCCDPANTNEVLLDEISIIKIDESRYQIDFGTIEFKQAEINIVNILGQTLTKTVTTKSSSIIISNNLVYQNGLILIQINLKTKNDSYKFVKKVISITN